MGKMAGEMVLGDNVVGGGTEVDRALAVANMVVLAATLGSLAMLSADAPGAWDAYVLTNAASLAMTVAQDPAVRAFLTAASRRVWAWAGGSWTGAAIAVFLLVASDWVRVAREPWVRQTLLALLAVATLARMSAVDAALRTWSPRR